ncbi:uncharacterized protein METZ01_LOCUS461429, partial [marine metagenome]
MRTNKRPQILFDLHLAAKRLAAGLVAPLISACHFYRIGDPLLSKTTN